MGQWNPWHGCRKISVGCQNCYVYRIDSAFDRDSSAITKTAAYNLPLKKTRNGKYKLLPGATVYTCFSSDFFLEEADNWRIDAWRMIKYRSDLHFFIITKTHRPVWGKSSGRLGRWLWKCDNRINLRKPGQGRLLFAHPTEPADQA